MEFRFDLNDIFKHPVVEIGNTLIPPGFAGDKRALWDTQSKVTQIVNAMGEASAGAQGLCKPITTAERLRNSEHRLYLLIDQNANNGKGAVTGMLKTGEKSLYVFDRNGQPYQVSPPCVLDFYIHESRQRSGFGKHLFEHMLQKEQIEPVRMAIDRPSGKFLGFLNKHYGLNEPMKQMNSFVVFDGFFPKAASPNVRSVDADKSLTPSKKQSANGLQHGLSSYGRYGAPRPTCSMGQIIHNDSPVIRRNQEPTGARSVPNTNNASPQGQYYPYSNNINNTSNQAAWQATQSVPNMPYNQIPNAAPTVQQSNQQNSQYQEYSMAQGDAPRSLYGMAQGDAPSYYPTVSVQTPNYYNQQHRFALVQPQQPKPREPLVPQAFDGSIRSAPHTAQSVPQQLGRHEQVVALQNTVSAPSNYVQQNMGFQSAAETSGQQHGHTQQPTAHQINPYAVASQSLVAPQYYDAQVNQNIATPHRADQSDLSNPVNVAEQPQSYQYNQTQNAVQQSANLPVRGETQLPSIPEMAPVNQQPSMNIQSAPLQQQAYAPQINTVGAPPLHSNQQDVSKSEVPHLNQQPAINYSQQQQQSHLQQSNNVQPEVSPPPVQQPLINYAPQQPQTVPHLNQQPSMGYSQQQQQMYLQQSNDARPEVSAQVGQQPSVSYAPHQQQQQQIMYQSQMDLTKSEVARSNQQNRQNATLEQQSLNLQQTNNSQNPQLSGNQMENTHLSSHLPQTDYAKPHPIQQQSSLNRSASNHLSQANNMPVETQSLPHMNVAQPNVRNYQEVDLSKGYPPQHFQHPVAARPPIVIRN